MVNPKFTRSPILAEQIKGIYSNISLTLNQEDTFNKVNEILGNIKPPCEFAKVSAEKELIDLYSMYRSWIMFSEGMNKIWPTVELHYKGIETQMKLKNFNIWFSNSLTIPALHYANIYFLLSFMTAFGLIPLRRNKMDMFLIRQNSSYYAIMKSEYAKQQSLKASSDNWHVFTIKAAEDVAKESNIELPFSDIDCIRKARMYLDYEILTKPSLLAQIGELYYGKSLKVSINLAIRVYEILRTDLGQSPRNGADKRFEGLKPLCEELIKKYSTTWQNKTFDDDVPCFANLS